LKPTIASSIPFSTLLDNLIDYLLKKNYCSGTIQRYLKCGEIICQYLADMGKSYIDSEVYDCLVSRIATESDCHEKHRIQKELLRCLNATLEYAAQREITFRDFQQKLSFHGDLGKSIRDNLEICKSNGMADKTIENKRDYLIRFQEHLEGCDIFNPTEIKAATIIDYCLTLKRYSLPTAHCMLAALRGYLKYLYQTGIQSSDLSSMVPKDNYKKQAKLPSTYTAAEIREMLSNVDRGSPKGKRDYAMILLAALIGIRASDVCGLKFCNLNWEQNLIIFEQKKTHTPVELPLLAEIGNALIDYLRYGRPESESPYIFLHVSGRYEKLDKETFHSIVTHYLRVSGIDMTNRKHGPHAMRHSLAGRLLDAKIPLPVISETLGHRTSDSTMLYLRIDLKHLKQCALEVPTIATGLYGGV